MTSFFDDLEAQLRTAARSRVGASAGVSEPPHKPRRRWVRTGISVAPVLAALLVTLLVVGAALLLVGPRGHGGASGSRPPGGGINSLIVNTPQRQLRREVAYISAATRAVQNSKPCRLQQPNGVTYINGSPGSDVLSFLGVLRRPATPADRVNLSGFGPMPDEVYRAYVRRAASVDGTSYYIVPARFDRAGSLPSVRCFELQTAALRRDLPKIPASLRQPTRALQAGLIAWLQRAAANAPRDTICFFAVGGNTNSGGCGFSPEQIKAGQVPGGDWADGQTTYSGVVPDGVAIVTLTWPAAAGHPERSVTTTVAGNVYAVHVSQSQSPRFAYFHPPTVIWRAARGRVLKRISAPQAASRAAVCKHYPVQCLLAETASGTSTSTASGTSTTSTTSVSAR